jgi:hypothetical protein
MPEFGKQSKYCSTCEYWIGPRKPNGFRNSVSVDSMTVHGECVAPRLNRSNKLASLPACSYWRLWAVLD